jgi:hypothetical protein
MKLVWHAQVAIETTKIVKLQDFIGAATKADGVI